MDNLEDYLNRPITDIEGVGEKTSEALHRIQCYKIVDLLFHFPTRILTKDLNPNLDLAQQGSTIIAKVEILELLTNNRNRVNKVRASYQDKYINLVFFSKIPPYLNKFLIPGNKVVVEGKLEKGFGNEHQIAHPKIYFSENKAQTFDVIYPTTYELGSYKIHSLIKSILIKLERFIHTEWLSNEILAANNWSSWLDSLKALHSPTTPSDIDLNSKHRKRIAFDEFLASQIAIKLMRESRDTFQKGIVIKCDGSLAEKVVAQAGFSLTNGQRSALLEIAQDQKSSKRMLRLLQGDVGSGKTLVALCAILNAIESGKQAALMVPTDILANQHFKSISKMLSEFDIKIDILTGKTTKSERVKLLNRLAEGHASILIGTHALFQDTVSFKDLGLVVIDEQHRFGVQQRLSLIAKQDGVDVLVMSATPIPRTLALTIYGDMEVSLITDKPQGRIPIKTYTVVDSKLDSVVNMIRDTITRDERVYWVCPLISTKDEADEEVVQDSSSVEYKKEYLHTKFPPEIIGTLHGKMNSSQKEEIMNKFIEGSIKILISTTVIEVGVDVAAATLLIVDSAERFGLAQLHQLRGRVGRSSKPSTCILLFSKEISFTSKQRLQVMKESCDGFHIAEQDFKLRGGGEILGSKQSGLPSFKTASLEAHNDLLLSASQYSTGAIKNSDKYSTLLKIFDYYNNIKLVEAS